MATTLESSWVLKGKEFLENTWVGPVENSIPNYLSKDASHAGAIMALPQNQNHGTDTVRNKERLEKKKKTQSRALSRCLSQHKSLCRRETCLLPPALREVPTASCTVLELSIANSIPLPLFLL